MADRFRRDQSVSDTMTRDIATVESSFAILEAARMMREADVRRRRTSVPQLPTTDQS